MNGCEKPILLFFHGLTGDPSEVRYLKEYLEPSGIELVTPLLPGHGESIATLARTRLTDWTEFALTQFDLLAKDRPRFVGGVSLGSLLALYITEQRPGEVAGLIALSPPIAIRSLWNSILLGGLSFLPEALLSNLWLRSKSKRPPNYLKYPHNAFKQHSIGALCRVLRLRRAVLVNVGRINCPVFLAQDSDDHHLSSDSCQVLQGKVPGPTTLKLYQGGQHELTLGHKAEQVFSDILNWLRIS